VLKNEPYLPASLLGHGSLETIGPSYPTPHQPIGFRWYYLGTMGYHVHQMVQHAFFEEIRGDFVEMFLHHVVTLMLYGFSYLINMTAAGSVVMFLHDWADIFTSIVRCFTETTLLPFTLVGITGMATTWVWTRLYIFP
jgi:hypothetical protein